MTLGKSVKDVKKKNNTLPNCFTYLTHTHKGHHNVFLSSISGTPCPHLYAILISPWDTLGKYMYLIEV